MPWRPLKAAPARKSPSLCMLLILPLIIPYMHCPKILRVTRACTRKAGTSSGKSDTKSKRSWGLQTLLCSYLRSEGHTSELQSLMRSSYAVFCLKKKKNTDNVMTHDMSTDTHKRKNTVQQDKH